MPYAILPEDESVQAALRRIAREEAEGALAQVRGDGDLGPRVHAMRKTVKKLRGLLRLVRPVFPHAGAENAVLRDAGRGLSALRDAAVQLSTAERLTEPLPDDRRTALLAPFREAARHHDARAEAEMLPPFADAMSSLVSRSEGWRLKKEGWDALEPGLVQTWEAARKAMKAARRDPDPEALHEWRKRTKDHWYQARLLRHLWAGMMDPHISAADDLGEMLGQVNDLAVFRERLDAADLSPALRSEAQDLATVRHAELMAQVVPLGRRLFAGDAEGLTRRWGTWWSLRGSA
ncbi:CHAD domain-containing protein [Rubellimicrobium arenae]|uniref:CHAD domain-containing protein n=1 Tax=Rubellimicrobium arenae TaxID=2817372 RepID=UPI001B316857|nr:CHAD domain-containing protein [Rubellimicrobium arenae]